jgi:hypothetical protein
MKSCFAVAAVTVAAIFAAIVGLAVNRPVAGVGFAGAGFVTWFGFVGVRLAR